jgi:transposase
MNAYQKRLKAQAARAVVGIDAAKRVHTAVVRTAGGPDSVPFQFAATREGFVQLLEELERCAPGLHPSEVLFAIEFAGNYGYTLAFLLRAHGYEVVSVLPKHTKHWKEVFHNQRLKSDPADALTITDLAARGSFVGFPFHEQVYADLRGLVSEYERLTKLRTGTIARLKDVLQVVWPEFEARLCNFGKKTPIALLKACPGPDEFLRRRKATVLQVIAEASHGQHGEDLYNDLCDAARTTIALVGAQGLKDEIGRQIELLASYERQIAEVRQTMIACLQRAPEGEALLSIPKLGEVTAAVFLGSIGDPRTYDSSRQALRVGGLSLIVTTASGSNPGKPRLSKRGRPELRRLMYMFAVRSVTKDGIYRAEYERGLARNPNLSKKVLVGISRKALRMMFRVAYERRLYSVEAPK